MNEDPEMAKALGRINFGLLSPSVIRQMSVVEIRTADTYDEDGAPITSGLMDGRLGTLEPRQRCQTLHLLSSLSRRLCQRIFSPLPTLPYERFNNSLTIS